MKSDSSRLSLQSQSDDRADSFQSVFRMGSIQLLSCISSNQSKQKVTKRNYWICVIPVRVVPLMLFEQCRTNFLLKALSFIGVFASAVETEWDSMLLKAQSVSTPSLHFSRKKTDQTF